MNKLQAMAKIIMLLNPDGILKQGNTVYERVREMASEKIATLGPDAAVACVKKILGNY